MRNIRKFIHCIISSLKPHQNFILVYQAFYLSITLKLSDQQSQVFRLVLS